MRAIFDFSARRCDLDVGPADHGVQTLYFGFRDNGQLPVIFDSLTFGWALTQDDGVGHPELPRYSRQDYPDAPDVEYVATYEDYAHRDTLLVLPDTHYTLEVWAQNAGARLTATESFLTGPPLSMDQAMQKVEPLDVEI
jgi:hypothetical protein